MCVLGAGGSGSLYLTTIVFAIETPLFLAARGFSHKTCIEMKSQSSFYKT